ncbi:tetratricopeptide repeat protein [Acidicapsa ligni]|uniref:tetratricopeptide repeat protein n=1 Tax=Acidicapsa ligni TaxID=542300 RepID=UPI0021E085AB|nr:tetratricopeptide repeat protein [Acidicapsa ligni]
MLFCSFLVLMSFDRLVPCAYGQSNQSTLGGPALDGSAPVISPASSLDLTSEKASLLSHAIAVHDYTTAEKLLLDEIQRDPHSPRAAHLLALVGNVYFLNRDYIGAAIAWKKSEAIMPLEPSQRFSLSMAYIRLGHPDWARAVLVSLTAQQPKEALFPYWLGRLDYDAHEYGAAIQHFQQAVNLAPGMARAYDNLGLCYFYLNENSKAIDNYKKAIDLDRTSEHPSAWPYLNLAETLQFLGRVQEAEPNVREAVHLDPQLAVARYRLGSVLEDLGQLEAAVPELLEAAKLDDKYAEPHIALAHIYNKLGRKDAAREETQVYLRLHGSSADASRKSAPSN